MHFVLLDLQVTLDMFLIYSVIHMLIPWENLFKIVPLKICLNWETFLSSDYLIYI